MIIGTYEHGDRNLLNVAQVNQISLFLAIKPVLIINFLLKPIDITIHLPVNLWLDSLTLKSINICAVISARFQAKVFADGLKISVPIGPIDCIDAMVLELHIVLVEFLDVSVLRINPNYEARSKLDHLVNILGVELAF